MCVIWRKGTIENTIQHEEKLSAIVLAFAMRL